MIPEKAILYIGIILGVVVAAYAVIGIITNHFKGFVAISCIAFMLLSAMLMLAPTKGFWETSVKGDDITTTRLWLIKKKVKISEISYCRQTKGGTHIYLIDSKKKELSIDSMCTNHAIFHQRMEYEGTDILTNE